MAATSPANVLRPVAAVAVVLAVLTAAGLLAGLGTGLDEATVVLLLLGAVVVAAYLVPWYAAIAAAFTAVVVFDVFFVEPRLTLVVDEPRYFVTFAVMAAIGLLVSLLASRNRAAQARLATRAERLESLNRLAQAFLGAETEEAIHEALAEHGRLALGTAVELAADDSLVLEAPERADPLIVVACEAQTRTAISRLRLERVIREERLELETERLRSAVLSSVSHDLRTPLGGILGAATTLADGSRIDQESRGALVRSIAEQSRHLARQLDNLLEMTRIEGGALRLRRDWFPPEEIVAGPLRVCDERGQRVELELVGAGLVHVDAVAAETAVLNLLENAHKHGEAPVTLRSELSSTRWELRVLDAGPGIAEGMEDRIFEKFERAEGVGPGSGLGLAIVAALVRAHDGDVWARNLPDGGADIGFAIPLGTPPEAPEEAPIE